jgi:general secretion pathway protein B
MSFILDALRKSEAERQRQDGPTLLEMRPSRPQRRVPVWVIGLGVLLLLNMAVLVWFLLRTPSDTAAGHAQRPTLNAPAPQAAAPPAASAPVNASKPPPAPLLAPSNTAPATSAPPAAIITTLPASAHPAAPAPAKPARPQLQPSESGADLPDYSRVSAGMPALRLDLHSYSDQPQQRYALINMHKVQEGDTLPEGPRVLHILPDGVVLSYQGTEFVLGRN